MNRKYATTALKVVSAWLISTTLAQAAEVTTTLQFSPNTAVVHVGSVTSSEATGTSRTVRPASASATPASVITTTSQGWTFTGNLPKIAMIPFDDDLSIPVPLGIAEYVLTDPSKGAFIFEGRQVYSAVRIPLDLITTPSLPTRTQRPTLFISIPGLQLNNTGIDQWQTNLSYKLSTLTNTIQYKHFLLDWNSAQPMQAQATKVVSEHIKSFLASKIDSWDVVLVGHSRGAIFAHELAKRLSGNGKISKLHVWMLEPTSAPSFGDIYPFQLPSGSQIFGYMKYDGRPFFYANLSTTGDQNVPGYNNYGRNNFLADIYTGSNPPANSHEQYANTWVALTNVHGYDTALQDYLGTKDNTGGSFVVDGDSGNEIIVVRAKSISGDMFADCSGTTCQIGGALTVGLGTVAFDSLVATNGLNLAVSTTIAAASAVIREDYASVQATNVFTDQAVSARIDRNGITTTSSLINGQSNVTTQLGLTGGSVTVTIGDVVIPIINVNPVAPILPPIRFPRW